MTRRELLYFFFRWKNTILGWTLFITLLVTLLVYQKPLVYETHSTVLIERTKAPLVVSDIYTVPDVVEAMNTEIGIALSRPVVESVVDQLHLADDASGSRDEGLGERLSDLMAGLGLTNRVPLREAWIADLLSSLKAEAGVDSNILKISYASQDPGLAARIVNAATDAYIAHRLEVYSPRGVSEFYKARMDRAAAELDRLRQQLASFKQERSVTAIDDNRAQLVREMGTLREQLTAARQELADLTTRFAPNHPRALIAQQNIATLESELDARNRELQDLENWAATIQDLEVRIKAQEDLFVQYQNRVDQEQAEEGASQDLVNARVVQYAPVPAQPRMVRLTYIEAGALGGLLLALLIALLRQYFDRRVSDPETAERALGVPVIGSIPKVRG